MKPVSSMILAMILAVVPQAHAGIQIVGTRVVYPAAENEVTINLVNNGASTRLLQVWVDSGDPAATADTARAPFAVNPPMTRVEPGMGQSLRLVRTRAIDVHDRESVYWLNVLEIPPRPASGDDRQNHLQFAVRTRIKIFYRPQGLSGDAAGALARLDWKLVRQGDGYAVQCSNPSAYNVSFASVRLKQAHAVRGMDSGGMCPARGQQVFALEDGKPAAGAVLLVTAINDYGGFVEREIVLPVNPG